MKNGISGTGDVGSGCARVRRGVSGMVTADLLLVATIVSFLAVVIAFGWWRARQVEPPARASGALGRTVAMALLKDVSETVYIIPDGVSFDDPEFLEYRWELAAAGWLIQVSGR